MDNNFVLSNSGHIALAKSFIEQDIFVAWGGLINKVNAPSGVGSSSSKQDGGTLAGTTPVYVITAFNDYGETTASVSTTVSIVSPKNSAVITWTLSAGATGFNIYRYDTTLGAYKLIGTVAGTVATFTDTGLPLGTATPPVTNSTSDDAWTDTPPSANAAHTKLYSEVGRRRALIKKYVVPDVNGSYQTPNGTWSESDTPTRYVYIQVGFALEDASNQTIYQMGLFVGTTPVAGYENANYLLPNQVSSQGTLFSLSNVAAIYRNASTREIREMVVTF